VVLALFTGQHARDRSPSHAPVPRTEESARAGADRRDTHNTPSANYDETLTAAADPGPAAALRPNVPV
jgi:hypothetical protein